jgi:uncharacterized damage-inducible protein DinB
MTTSSTPPTSVLGEAFEDLDSEFKSTRKVLERFPEGKADWRPHDKSRTIGQLAAHVAQLPGLGIAIVTQDHLDAGTRPTAPTLSTAAELVEHFDKNVEAFRNAIARLSAEDLDKTWSLGAGGRVFVSGVRRKLLRPMLVNHLIHHRAQLGVYYRLLGVPVPGIYGPTADEPF